MHHSLKTAALRHRGIMFVSLFFLVWVQLFHNKDRFNEICG